MTETNRTNDPNHTMIPASNKGDSAPDQQALSRAEIATYQLSAATVSERRRWLLIGLLADNLPLPEIARITGYRPRTIREMTQRYHASGADALVDRRTLSHGAPPLLSPALQHQLRQMLKDPPPHGHRWTGPMVAQWIAEQTGKHIHRQRGWEYLQRLREVIETEPADQPSAQTDAAIPHEPT